MSTDIIPFPNAGWLGSRLIAWAKRKLARVGGKRLASPKQMEALRKKFAKT